MRTPWDRLAARVKRAQRSEDEPDEHGYRSLARLGELTGLAAAVQGETDSEIITAHEQGMDWPTIGGVLGMTKQGAQHRYRIALTRTGKAETYTAYAVRSMTELKVKPD